MGRAMGSRILMVAVAVLVAGFAGCVSQPPTDEGGDEDENGTPGTIVTEDGKRFVPLRFEGEARNHTANFQGAFQAHETCPGPGCFTGEAFDRHDITDLLPTGQPVTLDIRFTHPVASGSGLTGGFHAFFWVNAEDATIYTGNWNQEPGEITASYVLVRHSGDILIEVHAVYPLLDPEPLEYELGVEARSHVHEVPPGIPVAVPLEAGGTLALESEGEALVLAYDGDDRLLGRLAVGPRVSLEADQNTTGAHVIVPTGASDPVRLFVTTNDEQAPGALEPLGFVNTWGDERELEGTETNTWSFDVDDHPLIAGVVIRSQDEWFMLNQWELELELPDGTTHATTAYCGPGCGGASGSNAYAYALYTPLGTEGLVPGTYTAHVTPDAAHGFTAQEFTVRYAR